MIITKITNKEQGYTMVDVFSTYELAKEFTDKFIKNVIGDNLNGFNRKWDIQTESKELDKPDYPILNS